MNKRNALKVFIFVLFTVLIIMFFVFAKIRIPESADFSCIDSACVRFCKADQNVTWEWEPSIDKLTNPATNQTLKFHMMHGEPCEKMKLLDADEWTFSSVSRRKKNTEQFKE